MAAACGTLLATTTATAPVHAQRPPTVDSGKLNLSPPVVTRAVAELEARLGLRLLTRTTRVVRVTDAGARFAEDCRRILADIEEAETVAADAHAAPRGTLTLSQHQLGLVVRSCLGLDHCHGFGRDG